MKTLKAKLPTHSSCSTENTAVFFGQVLHCDISDIFRGKKKFEFSFFMAVPFVDIEDELMTV